MRFILAIAVAVFAAPALASPECNVDPQAKWLTEAEMMERINLTAIQVDVFKTTKGKCYEIYGRDQSGKRVEVYFNPVTGEVVKSSAL